MRKHIIIGSVVAAIVFGFVLVKNQCFKDRDPDHIVEITQTALKDAVLVVDYSINYDHLSQAAARECRPYQVEGEQVSVTPMWYDITVGLIPQRIDREMKRKTSDGSGEDVRHWDNRREIHILTDVCEGMGVRRELNLGDVPIYSFRFSVAPTARGVTNYQAAVFVPMLDSRYLVGRYQTAVEVQTFTTRALRGTNIGGFGTLGFKSVTTRIPDQPAPPTYEWKRQRQLIEAESGGTLNIDELVTVEFPPNALREDSEVRVDVLLARGQAMTCLITKQIRGLPEKLPLGTGKAVQVRLNHAGLGNWEDLAMNSPEPGQQLSAGLPGVAVNKAQKTVTFEAMRRAHWETLAGVPGTGNKAGERVRVEELSPIYQLTVSGRTP
jgi:hypothetical protein